MNKPSAYLVATIFALLAWVPQAGASGRGSTPSPVIESAEHDPVQHRLILSGSYFGGTTPLVMLGEYRLEVSESTPNQVVAKLPLDLRAATYRLLVSNTESFSGATSLYLQILAPAEVASIRDR